MAVFTEGILVEPPEPINMDLEAHSVPAFFSALDGVYRGVHFNSDAEGLVVNSENSVPRRPRPPVLRMRSPGSHRPRPVLPVHHPPDPQLSPYSPRSSRHGYTAAFSSEPWGKLATPKSWQVG